MTTDEKLEAIVAAVQTDPGNRGLARDPHDNLFTATAGQLQAACRSIADHPSPVVAIFTGFWIPSATPPAFETDGPPGVWLLGNVLLPMGCCVSLYWEQEQVTQESSPVTHLITCERPGPTADGSFRTMRGRDITGVHRGLHQKYLDIRERDRPVTIGIGDGGNEVGMGSIPAGTMAKNIADAERVRCVEPCDHLIVAGVSNWGAVALAAGVKLIRGHRLQQSDFAEATEQQCMQTLVSMWGLVDGVTGRQEATVDGLPWDVYAAPLVRIREILELP